MKAEVLIKQREEEISMNKKAKNFFEDVKENSIGALNNNVIWLVCGGFGVLSAISNKSIIKGLQTAAYSLGFNVLLNGVAGAVINQAKRNEARED